MHVQAKVQSHKNEPIQFVPPSEPSLPLGGFWAEPKNLVQTSCIACRTFIATRRFLENFQKHEKPRKLTETKVQISYIIQLYNIKD